MFAAIRKEIEMIEEGKLNPLDNPLKNAPHPITILAATNWDRPYPREMACAPAVSIVWHLLDIFITHACTHTNTHTHTHVHAPTFYFERNDY